jgi:hypothetical protein
MAISRQITVGEDYTPDDINNLRGDVLDPIGGHKHNGVDGARVPFANLDVTGAAGSTPPPGGSKSYNELANHVASSQGQHGLPANSYVMGAAAAGMMMQGGASSFIGSSRGISFNPPFDSGTVPIVVATYAAYPTDVSNPTETTAIFVLDHSHTGCTVYTAEGAQWGNKPFHWMAFGVKTT